MNQSAARPALTRGFVDREIGGHASDVPFYALLLLIGLERAESLP